MKKTNIFKKLFIAAQSLLLIYYVNSCGAAQTDINDTIIEIEPTTAEVSDTEITSLSITEGKAKGSNISVPPGALSTGTTLSLEPVLTPDSFNLSAVNGKGAAIKVVAKSSGGAEVTSLASPMTLSLPVQALSLSLFSLVTQSDDNLCVLLSSGSSLIVWRAADITIATLDGSKVAQISSLKLGTFQLVYCGNETLAGFQDASEAGAAGGSYSSVSVTLDTSTYGFGANKVCIAALADSTPDGTDDNGPDIMMGGGEITVDNTSKTVTFDAYTSVAPSGSQSFLVLLYIDSTMSCPDNTPTNNFDTTAIQFVNLVGFPLELTTLNSNPTYSIAIGSGTYSFMSVSMQVGTVQTPFTDNDLCVQIENKTNGPYFAEYSSSLVYSTSTIDGLATRSYFVPAPSAGTADQYSSRVTIGGTCYNKGNMSYEINYPPTITAGTAMYLDSLDVSFTNATLTGQTACLEFYSLGGMASGEKALLEADLVESVAKQYFFPYLSTYSVDFQLSSGTCSSKGVSVQSTGQDASGAPYAL